MTGVLLKTDHIDLSKLLLDEDENDCTYNLIYNNGILLLETELLFCPYPIENINSKYVTHEIIIELDKKTLDFMERLDRKMIEIGSTQLKDKFKKNKTIKYQSIVRDIKDEGKKTMKIKLIKSKNFMTMVFDNQNKLINMTEDYDLYFNGQNHIKIILEISKIWIRDNIFGLYLKPHQIKIYELNNDSYFDSVDSISVQENEFNKLSYILSDSSE